MRAAVLLAVLALVRPAAAETPDEKLMKDGIAAFTQKRFGEAAKKFRKVLDHNSKHYGATFQLAAAYAADGKHEKARPYWERSLELAEAINDAGTIELARQRLPDLYPAVEVRTSTGSFTFRVNRKKSPITADNFLFYVDQAFYDQTTFHRIYRGSFVQGGGLNKDRSVKAPLRAPIKLESKNGLKNRRGTVSMARGEPDTATVQWFVNIADNTWMDYASPENPGYAVFGAVISGMDVVDRMGGVPTTGDGTAQEPIVIESIRRL
ncbi:MAG: peptidylprolyl isomerase [Elusimicrobia bacterium]|nr:peptidylprolyl isomerase [Elusimicrobiota bacterium]